MFLPMPQSGSIHREYGTPPLCLMVYSVKLTSAASALLFSLSRRMLSPFSTAIQLRTSSRHLHEPTLARPLRHNAAPSQIPGSFA